MRFWQVFVRDRSLDWNCRGTSDLELIGLVAVQAQL